LPQFQGLEYELLYPEVDVSNFVKLFKVYWSRDAPAVQHSTTVRSAHSLCVFVFMWEQTAACATYVIN
jgi:hypothetical protein